MSIDQYTTLHAHLATANALHAWVKMFTGLDVPRAGICPGHDAPFDYLLHAYFEPARDLVVWAPRGGGKTRLAAVATLLDLLHKPPCAVRILGGSLQQSLRMWEHLLPDLHELASRMLAQPHAGARTIRLNTGASAAVLTQSERAVRGLRVQKLRCDEVELFKPHIWQAAQLVTRSLPGSGGSGGRSATHGIAGAIEAISTLHTPFGLMHQILEQAQANRVRIVRWCLLEVLERCAPDRPCAGCPLWDDCHGIAKTRCNGFVTIDDAIAMKQRVSRETWAAEMMCRRPSRQGCVFASFDPAVHVRDTPPSALDASTPRLWLAIDFGFANPFVCLWVRFNERAVYVIDEYVQAQRTVHEHLQQIRRRDWGPIERIACDPAGAGPNEQTAKSSVQVLRESGFIVRSRPSRIVDGIDLIQTHLAPASGPARLFVHPRCAQLIRAMQSYRYEQRRGEIPVKDGTHDHPIDALRYFFVNSSAVSARTRAY